MFDSTSILIADDHPRLRGYLADQLLADGAEVHIAEDVTQARARAVTHRPDMLLLGRLGAPPAATALLRDVRAGDGLPRQPARDLVILVLLDDEHDLAVLRAFEAGADDVTARTVSYAVLRARMRAALAYGRDRGQSTVCRVGQLVLDRSSREVRVAGRLVELSAKEFALLSALAAEPTRVFTKDELLRDVWGFRAPGRTRTLDSHACRLRAKLAAAGGQRFVVNVWGVGYRLTDAIATDLKRAA